MRFLILTLCTLCLAQEKAAHAQKDLANFTLPDSVQKAAPEMQAQLLELLPMTSPLFKRKPEFVFLENGLRTFGHTRENIQRLNLLHVACYRKGVYSWGGSLMFAPGQGVTVFSRTNQMIGLSYNGKSYKVEFSDNNNKAQIELPFDEDHQEWFTSGDMRVYFNYYVFPQSLYDPSKSGPAAPVPVAVPAPNKQGWIDQGMPKDEVEKPLLDSAGHRIPWTPNKPATAKAPLKPDPTAPKPAPKSDGETKKDGGRP